MTRSALSLLVAALTTSVVADERPSELRVLMTIDGDWPVIQRVVDGTPASRMRLVLGDRVIAIDGLSTHRESLRETIRQLADSDAILCQVFSLCLSIYTR